MKDSFQDKVQSEKEVDRAFTSLGIAAAVLSIVLMVSLQHCSKDSPPDQQQSPQHTPTQP